MRPLAEVLRDDWRPTKPELTDTVCHVLTARRPDGSLLGFASYFGCHPVCCCEETRAIHGAVLPAVDQLTPSVPIYQTATFRFDDSEEYAATIAFEKPGFTYTRGYGNPTVDAFEAVMADHWAEGGKGAADAARAVVKVIEQGKSKLKLLYPDDMPLADKIGTIAKEIYRASGVTIPKPVRDQLASFEAMGYGKVPVCIAKTQYSFSTNPDLKGAPDNHIIAVREARLSAGAEFVVVICGEIGLGGEVRTVRHAERRLAEAVRAGFRRAIVPSHSAGAHDGITVIPVATLSEALTAVGLTADCVPRAERRSPTHTGR